MHSAKHIGKVILAGAGPGDPELITLKAVRYLQQAEIVLTDRLVSDEILRRYVHPDAEIIHVGKQSNGNFSATQKTINELLLKYALQGKLVVRLKGGDVSIFSNILDELETLVVNNISYEIIPGITAALGAAAYAGIPLTARGYSTSVRFLTYYKSDIAPAWRELAETDDTLVFYMTSELLDSVVSELIACNIAEDKLLAVIEQATTPLQNIRISNLYQYEQKIKGQPFISPTLVIIGRVVALNQQFAWLSKSDQTGYYFKPIKERKELSEYI